MKGPGIPVSGEVLDLIRDHLEQARYLPDDAAKKIAWIRGARQLLLFIDPDVGDGFKGILGQAWADLTKDLQAIDEADQGADVEAFLWVLTRHLASAVTSLNGVEDCLLFAPEALGSATPANPYFFDLPNSPQGSYAFVLMPFTVSWASELWDGHLKQIVESCPVIPRLRCIRADDLFGHDVLLDIVSAIRGARVVIADITGRNANVFYELGIAHSLGKRVVLITQNAADIPFDLQRFRHVIYGQDGKGRKVLERGLKGAILEILK